MTSPRRLSWACVVVVAVIVSAPKPSQADEPASESESHLQRGFELRKLGKNADALVEFQQAYGLVPTPRARAQVALALQALGDWVGAELGLEDALGAADEPWIRQYRRALDGALATVREHLAWLWIDANVPSGEMLLNGVAVHSIPLERPIRVIVGSLDIEVRGAGHLPAHRRLEVLPGTTLRETFALEPIASSPGPLPVVGSGAVVLTEAHASGARPQSEQGWKTGAYIAGGTAAALAGGGLAAWRVREDQIAMYNDDARCRIGLLTRNQRCGGAGQAADIALGLEIGAFAAAAISASAGAWLLWRSNAHSSRAATWCAPSALMGASCGGAF
jgi:hypothetical protein